MLFWLKKTIGYWLMPFPLCLALLTLGVVLLMTQRARLGRYVVAFALLLLGLLGNKLVSVALIRPIETRFAPIPEVSAHAPVPAPLAGCRYVAVLGGGNGHTPGMAALSLLSGSGRSRLTEGVRLLRLLPEAKLIVSGPGEQSRPDRPTHAVVLARAAMSLGIPEDRIELIDEARDTEEETAAIKRKVGNARVALVTSAFHMPRSMALARHAGVDAVPCPTDYSSHADGTWGWADLIWDLESLERSTWAVRERIGQLWITLRGIN
jgi:uncharacterized SAM-binding protein YcdF (DUF218 family)